MEKEETGTEGTMARETGDGAARNEEEGKKGKKKKRKKENITTLISAGG